MYQPAIILHPLLKTNEKFSEPIVPRAGAFDDPTARRMLPTSRDALTAMADMRGVTPLSDCRLDLREIVPLVEAQVLRMLRRRPRAPDGEAVQRGRRRLHIIGSWHR